VNPLYLPREVISVVYVPYKFIHVMVPTKSDF
jgi:hypothetical protein